MRFGGQENNKQTVANEVAIKMLLILGVLMCTFNQMHCKLADGDEPDYQLHVMSDDSKGGEGHSMSEDTYKNDKGKSSWRLGDGIGGYEIKLGLFANKEICYSKCFATAYKGQLANGATVDIKSGKHCHCEFSMKSRNRDRRYISRFIQRGKPSWRLGDGIGGFEIKLGLFANKEICYRKCFAVNFKGQLANGATVDTKSGKHCHCEFSMKSRNRDRRYKSSFIQRGKFSWHLGDGVGGFEMKIGVFANEEICYRKCFATAYRGQLANGATVDTKSGKYCHCEFGMKSRNHLRSYKSRLIQRVPHSSWRVGDGHGGFDVMIGTFPSKEICFQKCLSQNRKGKFANGATVDAKTGRKCYCEFGMTGRYRNYKFKTRYIHRGQFTAVVCEGRRKILRCWKNQVLDILHALYGRTDKCTCANPNMRNQNCGASRSQEIVFAICQGKQRCSLSAKKSIFGDPCGGSSAYLYVRFRCLGEPTGR